MSVIKHFIDGKSYEGSSKRTSKVFNPATGENINNVILASKADVDFTVSKAKNAFYEWSNKPPIIRARVLFKYKEIIEKNLMVCTSVSCARAVLLLVQAIGGMEKNI
jgi:malonate-semialdehyde dehydrogenase (acetylating)/methylmalonate-semialdehyde dehydrogenase